MCNKSGSKTKDGVEIHTNKAMFKGKAFTSKEKQRKAKQGRGEEVGRELNLCSSELVAIRI
jgi:hypothetical protein